MTRNGKGADMDTRVADMFRGDRYGKLEDPDGFSN